MLLRRQPHRSNNGRRRICGAQPLARARRHCGTRRFFLAAAMSAAATSLTQPLARTQPPAGGGDDGGAAGFSGEAVSAEWDRWRGAHQVRAYCAPEIDLCQRAPSSQALQLLAGGHRGQELPCAPQPLAGGHRRQEELLPSASLTFHNLMALEHRVLGARGIGCATVEESDPTEAASTHESLRRLARKRKLSTPTGSDGSDDTDAVTGDSDSSESYSAAAAFCREP